MDGFMVPGSTGGAPGSGRMAKPKVVSSDFRWGRRPASDKSRKDNGNDDRHHHSHHRHSHHSRSHSRHNRHHHSHHHGHRRSSSSSSSSSSSPEKGSLKEIELKKVKIGQDEPEPAVEKPSGLDLDALLLKQGISLGAPPQRCYDDEKQKSLPQQTSRGADANLTADLNKLAAQAMREKLSGNIAEYERIQAEVARLRASQHKARTAPPTATTEPSTVFIRKNSRSVDSSNFDEETADMKTLYMREKSRNYDKALAMSIIKGVRDPSSSSSGVDYAHEYGYDDNDGNNSYGDFSSSREMTQRQKDRAERRETQRLIQEHIRAESRLRSCYFCLDNDRCEKKFVVSLGDYVYLALPVKGSLAPFHCIVVPSRHVASIRTADEDVLEEVERYKEGLLRMFHTMGMEPLFMETCLDPRSNSHTFIDVIPLQRDLAGDAPMFFKEALTNCESEWAQHKKIIDTRGKKLSACIPPNFPYFHVDFDGKGWFLHVVESARDFKHYFGRSIAASILQVSPELYIKPHRKTPQEEDAEIKAFTRAWAPFDWTISHSDETDTK